MKNKTQNRTPKNHRR